MARLAAVPLMTAEKIASFLRSGRLAVRAGLTKIDDDGTAHFADGSELSLDYVVNSTNTSATISEMTPEWSPFWTNLRDCDSIYHPSPNQPARLGGGIGVRLDWKTMAIKSSRLSNCFLIGPATWFIVSLVTFSQSASKVVDVIASSL